ncbi:unnamed protein product [Laminaria digitata]
MPLALAAMLLMATGCGELLAPSPASDQDDTDYSTVSIPLTPLCTVNVQGKGSVSVEDDYIPSVVACENGNADFEALKAQAIAARTYAKFKMETSGSLVDGQGDQVYSCGRAPEEKHIRAARETAGQVLTHNGTVLAAFYVSGVRPSTASCVPTASDASRASSTDRRVERYVTYNRGKSGSSVRPSSLGHPGNPRNRGCMSQNGSDCLADQGKSHQAILRYYYGDDVRLTQLGGMCGGSTPDQNTGPTEPAGNDSDTTMGTETGGATGSACSGDSSPNILPRSAWGASTPQSNRQPHTPNRIMFHHTVQPTSASGPDAVRQIQNWHQRGYGMSDIAYHFVIDRDGTIYSGTPVDRIGAHKKGENIGSIGIGLIADFTKEQPQAQQIAAAVQLALSLAQQFGFELDASTLLGGFLGGATDFLEQLFGGVSNCGATMPVVTEFKYIRFTNSGTDDAAIDGVGHGSMNGTKFDMLNWATKVEEEKQVENAAAARGEANAKSCADYEDKVALSTPGGSLTLQFSAQFLSNHEVQSFGKHPSAAALTGCEKQGRLLVEVSKDGNTWVNLKENTAPGFTQLAPMGEEPIVPAGPSNGGNPTPGTDGSTPGPTSTPTGSNPGDLDEAKAAAMARAASAVDGRSSGGMCWRGVKAALVNAGYSRSSNLDPMGNYGPCSSYNFQLSAYCGGRNFANNANELMRHMNMKRLNVHPRDAPEGALIFWDKGCNGYHAVHGHVEIKIAGNRACSDFCGNIKSGGGNCSYVFIPVK